jgi:hypothetical protein
MLPMIWAKFLKWSKWSSKDFNKDRTEETIIILVLIRGGKHLLCTKKEVLGGW